MALEKTKYDGLYYRLDKNGKKVYVARIYKDGKDTTKTLGKEPQLNLKVANKMRLDIFANNLSNFCCSVVVRLVRFRKSFSSLFIILSPFILNLHIHSHFLIFSKFCKNMNMKFQIKVFIFLINFQFSSPKILNI